MGSALWNAVTSARNQLSGVKIGAGSGSKNGKGGGGGGGSGGNSAAIRGPSDNLLWAHGTRYHRIGKMLTEAYAQSAGEWVGGGGWEVEKEVGVGGGMEGRGDGEGGVERLVLQNGIVTMLSGDFFRLCSLVSRPH